MNAIQLDQLPHLCLEKIFTYLGLRNLVRCRVVCRQFKFYADQAKVWELAVTAERSYKKSCTSCKTWFRTGRPIDFASNSISQLAFSSYRSSSPFALHQELRFLHLHLHSPYFNFQILDTFKQLVHLEVKSVHANVRPVFLALPNLRVLKIVGSLYDWCIMEAPKLELLSFEESRRLQVQYPDSIKRVACVHRDYYHEDLTKFKNLEVLDIQCYGRMDAGYQSKLLNELNLKELNLTLGMRDSHNYETFKSSLVELMHQKAVLQRDELNIYLKNCLMLDANQLLTFKLMVEDPHAFVLTNYQHLRPDYVHPDLTSLHFKSLQTLQLSSAFFDRFPRIEKLTATGQFNQKKFKLFLENATALRELILYDACLNQNFMDTVVPSLAGRLIRLDVEKGHVTDFDFILQLERLRIFYADRRVSLPYLVEKAFQQLNELAYFCFRAKNYQHCEIDRFSRVQNDPVLAARLNSDDQSYRPTSPQNDYSLRLYKIEKDRNWQQRVCLKNLTWPQLVRLYDERMRGQISMVVFDFNVKRKQKGSKRNTQQNNRHRDVNDPR